MKWQRAGRPPSTLTDTATARGCTRDWVLPGWPWRIQEQCFAESDLYCPFRFTCLAAPRGACAQTDETAPLAPPGARSGDVPAKRRGSARQFLDRDERAAVHPGEHVLPAAGPSLDQGAERGVVQQPPKNVKRHAQRGTGSPLREGSCFAKGDCVCRTCRDAGRSFLRSTR